MDYHLWGLGVLHLKAITKRADYLQKIVAANMARVVNLLQTPEFKVK